MTKKKLPKKYLDIVERLTKIGDDIQKQLPDEENFEKELGEDLKKLTGILDAQNPPHVKDPKFYTAIREILMLASQMRIRVTINSMNMLYVAMIAYEMIQLVTLMAGQQEVKFRVKKNMQKLLNLWAQRMESAMKAQGQYIQ